MIEPLPHQQELIDAIESSWRFLRSEPLPHQQELIDAIESGRRFLGIDPASGSGDQTAVILCGLKPDLFIIDECHMLPLSTQSETTRTIDELTARMAEMTGIMKQAGLSIDTLRAETVAALLAEEAKKSSDAKQVPDRGPYKADPFKRKLSVKEMKAEFPNRAQRRAQAAKIRRK